MDEKSAEIIGFFFTYVLGGLVLGFMAFRKHREYWGWGLIGGLFWLPCIIALAFLPPLCPKCRRPLTARESRERSCPTCGCASAAELSEEDGYALLAQAASLEAKGQLRQAVVAYRAVAERHPGTAAAQDAQMSLNSLHARLG